MKARSTLSDRKLASVWCNGMEVIATDIATLPEDAVLVCSRKPSKLSAEDLTVLTTERLPEPAAPQRRAAAGSDTGQVKTPSRASINIAAVWSDFTCVRGLINNNNNTINDDDRADQDGGGEGVHEYASGGSDEYEEMEVSSLVSSSLALSSCFSVATSVMTVLPTQHGWQRMAQRQISTRELQSARKHGKKVESGDTWKIEHDGLAIITDYTQKRIITCWKMAPSVDDFSSSDEVCVVRPTLGMEALIIGTRGVMIQGIQGFSGAELTVLSTGHVTAKGGEAAVEKAMDLLNNIIDGDGKAARKTVSSTTTVMRVPCVAPFSFKRLKEVAGLARIEYDTQRKSFVLHGSEAECRVGKRFIDAHASSHQGGGAASGYVSLAKYDVKMVIGEKGSVLRSVEKKNRVKIDFLDTPEMKNEQPLRRAIITGPSRASVCAAACGFFLAAVDPSPKRKKTMMDEVDEPAFIGRSLLRLACLYVKSVQNTESNDLSLSDFEVWRHQRAYLETLRLKRRPALTQSPPPLPQGTSRGNSKNENLSKTFRLKLRADVKTLSLAGNNCLKNKSYERGQIRFDLRTRTAKILRKMNIRKSAPKSINDASRLKFQNGEKTPYSGTKKTKYFRKYNPKGKSRLQVKSAKTNNQEHLSPVKKKRKHKGEKKMKKKGPPKESMFEKIQKSVFKSSP